MRLTKARIEILQALAEGAFVSKRPRSTDPRPDFIPGQREEDVIRLVWKITDQVLQEAYESSRLEALALKVEQVTRLPLRKIEATLWGGLQEDDPEKVDVGGVSLRYRVGNPADFKSDLARFLKDPTEEDRLVRSSARCRDAMKAAIEAKLEASLAKAFGIRGDIYDRMQAYLSEYEGDKRTAGSIIYSYTK